MLPKWVLIAVTVVLTTVGIVVLGALRPDGTTAADLSEQEIVAKAITIAQTSKLQGVPTGVTAAKKISYSEFRARLDPFGQDQLAPDTPLWLVLLKGKATVLGPPGPSGVTTPSQFDNMWVLLTTGGQMVALGARNPGHEIDLNAPPASITSWPMPSEQERAQKGTAPSAASGGQPRQIGMQQPGATPTRVPSGG